MEKNREVPFKERERNPPEPILLTEGRTGATSEWIGHLVEIRAIQRLLKVIRRDIDDDGGRAAGWGWEDALVEVAHRLETRTDQILAACPEQLHG